MKYITHRGYFKASTQKQNSNIRVTQNINKPHHQCLTPKKKQYKQLITIPLIL